MLGDTFTLTHRHTLARALNSCQALKAVTLADSVEGVGVDRTKAGGSREGKEEEKKRESVCQG